MKRLMPLLLLLMVAPVLAQGECPAIVERAIQATGDVCADTARNEACVGHLALTATPREGVSADDFIFEQAGDITSLSQLDALELTPMDTAEETWGVVLMRVQANLPDTLPGQNVTMLLFGDVSLTNAAPAFTSVDAEVLDDASIYLAPNVESAVLLDVAEGDTISINGTAGDFVRVRLQDNLEHRIGWLTAEAVTADLSVLSEVDPAEPYFEPMQAFYFRGGLGDAPCAEAPKDGMLIQTPDGAETITLNANGLDIELGSTAFVQMGQNEELGEFMDVSVIEGLGRISANGAAQYVPAGTWARIRLDDAGLVEETPLYPEPYGEKRIQGLPITALPRTIEIAPPIPAEQIPSVLEIIEMNND
jgi:hypothetical protein